MKKFLLGVAVFIITAILCIVSAGAETYGDYEYTVLSDGTVEITKYTGRATEIEIPSEIDGKEVTSIGYRAFYSCKSLTSVTIPDSVTGIGDYALSNCTFLNSITIPDSITSIGDHAFSGCLSLKSVAIPDSITSIGSRTFFGCLSLKSVTIPASVTNIGESAFEHTDTINCYKGSYAEQYAKDNDLNYIYVSSSGYSYALTDDGTVIIKAYTGTDTDLEIPSEIDGIRVTSIGDQIFYNTSITSVTIPGSVTSIGDEAFAYCYSLKEITVDTGNKYYTSVNGILFDKEKTTLIIYPAQKNSTSYAIPDSVISIGDYAFNACSFLKSITIPNSVTSIGDSAFSGCESLVSITVDTENKHYSSLNGVFFNKEKTTLIIYPVGKTATSYIIPDSVTNISNYAFSGCTYLTSITIPNSVKSIGDAAFSYCNALTFAIIPDSVTSIGNSAFHNCNSLKSITIGNGIKNLDSFSFAELPKLQSVILGNGITSIDDYTFAYCSSLKSVTIPDSVTNIGEEAFTGCSALTSISIPKSVKNIGDSAFKYCIFLNSITISNGVTSIGDWAFSDCISLFSIIIPDSVTYIGEYAFFGCSSLKAVKIPRNVTYIGSLNFGFYLSPETDSINKVNGFTINCYKGTAGEQYAIDNGFSYNLITISAPTAMKGFKLGGRAADALRLNWTKNTFADGYIIEQYKSGKWVRIAKITNPATTTYRVTGLVAGTVYKFRMRAYKMDGSTALYSSYTSTLSARTNPSNVAGFKLGGRAADALRLNWTKNTSADGYIIEQYKDGKWVRIAKITSNATTTYKISGLKASTQYKFRVRAYKMSGKTALYSGYTGTLSAYTNPSKVANLKITGKATTALRLGWSKNTSADGYIIEMYKDGKWVRAAKITSNATVTFRKSGLKKGTTYKFRVKTYNMVGKTVLYGNYVNVSGTTK